MISSMFKLLKYPYVRKWCLFLFFPIILVYIWLNAFYSNQNKTIDILVIKFVYIFKSLLYFINNSCCSSNTWVLIFSFKFSIFKMTFAIFVFLVSLQMFLQFSLLQFSKVYYLSSHTLQCLQSSITNSSNSSIYFLYSFYIFQCVIFSLYILCNILS